RRFPLPASRGQAAVVGETDGVVYGPGVSPCQNGRAGVAAVPSGHASDGEADDPLPALRSPPRAVPRPRIAVHRVAGADRRGDTADRMSEGGELSKARPFDRLRTLAIQEVTIAEGLRHLEVYTVDGLLTLLWHGPDSATSVVLMCGGALGGLLGPARGLYHDLGQALAAEGVGAVRVGYRR